MKNTDKARKPGRKKPASRKQPVSAQSRRKGFWRLLLRLALLGLVLLAGWMVYLDAQVTSRFEGRRFEVPSRVYARPLELYSGAPVSASALEQELALAGFPQRRWFALGQLSAQRWALSDQQSRL
ncbi:MAG: hypothetical protein MH186_00785 [Marinobacter sp.]|nr:hypothetical protein [Marinobacter sp.]